MKDIIGIRVVCLDLLNLDEIVQEFKSSNNLEIIKEKRWIETADIDGYRGIHLIVKLKNPTLITNSNIKAELQIRTVSQHFWAIFSHRDLYKSNRVFVPHTLERVNQLSDELYLREKDVQRLRSEIKAEPLVINLPNLQSLLESLHIKITPEELRDVFDIFEKIGLTKHSNIPKLHTALTSEYSPRMMNMDSIMKWISYLSSVFF